MSRQQFVLSLTARQAEALLALAAAEELPPEVYAAEVLVKHLYHAYAPNRSPGAPGGSPGGRPEPLPPDDRAPHP